jgi:uncharacterized membrane protein YeaQ/YmgE (transglycosylase-associated protein family)
MNMALWILAGAVAGWLAFVTLNLNEHRGRFIAMVIGAVGGAVGGSFISPMLAGPIVAGAFSITALVIAVLVAAAFLLAGNFIYDRFGV